MRAFREKWYNMSIKIEDIVTKEKGLPPNVDFYSASVYHCLELTMTYLHLFLQLAVCQAG